MSQFHGTEEVSARDPGARPDAIESDSRTNSNQGGADRKQTQALFPGLHLLEGDRPVDIQRRLADGDPLGLHQRCSAHLRQRALLISLARLHQRSLALIASSALGYRGAPTLSEWIEVRLDEAVRQLRWEDHRQLRRNGASKSVLDERFAFLTEAFGIEEQDACRASIEFNNLDAAVRTTFFALVIEGREIHRYAAEGNGTMETLEDQLREGFRALAGLHDGRSVRLRREPPPSAAPSAAPSAWPNSPSKPAGGLG